MVDTYLDGHDVLGEAIDGFDGMYRLIVGQGEHLGALTPQTLACLMLPLLEKFRASAQMLDGKLHTPDSTGALRRAITDTTPAPQR